MIAVKSYISERYLMPFPLNMLIKLKKNRENSKNISYSVSDIFFIRQSNFLWYLVDKFSCKLERLGRLYEKTLARVYKREGKIFNISNAENILHIGCGFYPVTAITLAELNGGKIVGIDRNKKAIKPAIEVIKNKNLENRIKIEQGDGMNYPLYNFDTIIVSGCSVPKLKVLKHVFQSARSNTNIIIREMYSSSKAVDKLIDNYENIEILKKIGNTAFPTAKWESFYLMKK